MASAESKPNFRDRLRQSLLSQTSILILSAFLIGLAAQNVLPPRMGVYLFFGGAMGLFAYLGLDIVSHRRRHRETEAAQQAIESKLQNHLSRHQSPQTGVPPGRAPRTVDRDPGRPNDER